MDDEDDDIPQALRNWVSPTQRAGSINDSADEEDASGSEDEGEEDEDDALPSCLRGALDGIEDRPMQLSPFDVVPRVYKDAPEMYLRGLSAKWLASMWPDKDGVTLLTAVFNYEYTDDDVYNRLVANALKSAASWISGDSGIKAVPPEPKHEGMRKRDAPFLWGLRGFSEEGARRMRESPIWSFKAISFFIVEKAVRPDEWVFSLAGFLDDDTKEIGRAVRAVLMENENLEEIARLTKRNPEFRGMREDHRIKLILGSVRVDTWTMSNNNTVANVYIRPPTRVTAKWDAWVGGLRALRYSNYVNGTGRVRHIAHCAGCRGTNHPTHLCPFPNMPGWNGPEAGVPSFTRMPLPDLKPKKKALAGAATGTGRNRGGERGHTGDERRGTGKYPTGAIQRPNPPRANGGSWNRTPRTPRQDTRRR